MVSAHRLGCRQACLCGVIAWPFCVGQGLCLSPGSLLPREHMAALDQPVFPHGAAPGVQGLRLFWVRCCCLFLIGSCISL